MSNITKDIQSLLNIVIENLQSNIMTTLECAANADEIKKRITQHFNSSAYNIFNHFQTKSKQDSFFRHHFNLVVWYYIAYIIICDWIQEKPPATHKGKYLEIHNSIVQ